LPFTCTVLLINDITKRFVVTEMGEHDEVVPLECAEPTNGLDRTFVLDHGKDGGHDQVTV
jgi:hypothetical protein